MKKILVLVLLLAANAVLWAQNTGPGGGGGGNGITAVNVANVTGATAGLSQVTAGTVVTLTQTNSTGGGGAGGLTNNQLGQVNMQGPITFTNALTFAAENQGISWPQGSFVTETAQAIAVLTGAQGLFLSGSTFGVNIADNVTISSGNKISGNGAGLTNVVSVPTNSVIFYGADPTGVADSTAAFSACATNNLVCYIPSGQYSIKGITDNRTNGVWYGDGPSSQVYLSAFPTGTNVFNSTNAQCSFHDFAIFGDQAVSFGTGATSPLITGIAWNCLSNGSIRNMIISGFAVGIQVNGADQIFTRPQNGFIFGCTISNCFNGIYLVATNQSEYVRVENNSLLNCTRAIGNFSAANVQCIGNKCLSNEYALYVNPSPSSTAGDGSRGHSLYEGNVFNHSVFGVAIFDAMNVEFIGNTLLGSGTLNLTNSTNGIFNNNFFQTETIVGGSFTTVVWINLSAGVSNEFRFNTLLPGSGSNIIGATAVNSYFEGNHLMGGATNSLIGPIIGGIAVLNGFDWSGNFYVSGGLTTTLSNNVAPTAIAFPATTVNWVNTLNFDIELYINNATVTGTSIKKNNTTVFTSVTGDATLHLQPGESFSETYTVGSPSATYSPW